MGKQKNCTIRELARYVGLSTCTVSKVLNHPSEDLSIPERTREKVRAAARKLNYVPNVNAQRFFTRRSFVIGLLIPSQEEMGHNVFHDTHFADIMSGIEQALKGTAYHLLLLFNRPDFRYAWMFSSGLLDGLLIWGAHRSEQYREKLVELTGPRIFLTSIPDSGKDAPPLHYIASDYEQAAEGVAGRLKKSGCTRFCWLAGKMDTSIISQLRSGMEKAGVTLPDSAVRYSDYTEADGEALAAELLRDGRYDALVATAPQLARGAAHYVKKRKLDVRIGCFDGQKRTRLPSDRFLCAQTDDVEIGKCAIEQLLALLENRETLVQRKIPVTFAENGILSANKF